MSSDPTPPQYHAVGIALAIGSGCLIGSSFVFKKKGLLASQGANLGEGVAYLKNPVWWTGMIMMILGELMNFGAYAFVAAIIVTPMGALSVVICAILSSIFLKERLSFLGWIACGQCIIGSTVIAINAPEQQSVTTIAGFKHLFLAPGFLAFGSVVIVSALIIIFFFAPKYGDKNMLWYISVCSLIGGLSVSCTQGLGSCIVTSIKGDNQFKNWFIYFLLGFVAITLITEVYFLNRALALFNTAMVTPVYFVMFVTSTLVTSMVLYQGVKASATQLLTVFFGFLTICSGITILQLSKVEPTKLRNLDRRTTILLQAAREEVNLNVDPEDPEKGLLQATEEPGLDALRGTFGGLGTISRSRRRMSMISGDGSSVHRSRSGSDAASHGGLFTRHSTASAGSRRRSRNQQRPEDGEVVNSKDWENVAGKGVRKFQLHDIPSSPISPTSPTTPGKSQTGPPSSFLHPGRRKSQSKRRNSHDSAAAVRGSVADPNHTPRVGAEVPLHGEADDGIIKEGDEDIENGDLSMGLLLAQQQWADRRQSISSSHAPADTGAAQSSVAGAGAGLGLLTSSNPNLPPGARLVSLPPAGTKHTTIQFVEPMRSASGGIVQSNNSGGIQSRYPRGGRVGDVPPISHTPPALRSPSSSHPDLHTTVAVTVLPPSILQRDSHESAQSGRSGASSTSGLGGPMTVSPPLLTPEDGAGQPIGERDAAPAVGLVRRITPPRTMRTATSVQRQLLERTDEVTEESTDAGRRSLPIDGDPEEEESPIDAEGSEPSKDDGSERHLGAGGSGIGPRPGPSTSDHQSSRQSDSGSSTPESKSDGALIPNRRKEKDAERDNQRDDGLC